MFQKDKICAYVYNIQFTGMVANADSPLKGKAIPVIGRGGP
jgi:hypothetical protein